METQTRYLLQRADERKVWEEVDEYVYRHHQKAVLPNGDPRYSGNRILKLADGTTDLTLEGMDSTDLGIITRFLGVRVEQGSVPGGFVRTPEFVKMILQQNRVVLHEIGGDNFKKSAAS